MTVNDTSITIPEDAGRINVCAILSTEAAVPVTVVFNTVNVSATGEMCSSDARLHL